MQVNIIPRFLSNVHAKRAASGLINDKDLARGWKIKAHKKKSNCYTGFLWTISTNPRPTCLAFKVHIITPSSIYLSKNIAASPPLNQTRLTLFSHKHVAPKTSVLFFTLLPSLASLPSLHLAILTYSSKSIPCTVPSMVIFSPPFFVTSCSLHCPVWSLNKLTPMFENHFPFKVASLQLVDKQTSGKSHASCFCLPIKCSPQGSMQSKYSTLNALTILF